MNAVRIAGAVFLLTSVSLAPAACEQAAREDMAILRERMVAEQIEGRGVSDERVLAAMRRVPRHEFVPPRLIANAYDDRPLPIGDGQTISQPYIVAYMTEALRLEPGDRVLEVGTGSGYQAAVLAEITDQVYTIEIIPDLARTAEERLRRLGYGKVSVRAGDGYFGWPEKAPFEVMPQLRGGYADGLPWHDVGRFCESAIQTPGHRPGLHPRVTEALFFDAIIVTAAPEKVPPKLVEQLKEGGRMVIPVGEERSAQELIRLTKRNGKVETENLIPVRFVPLTGDHE